MKMYEKINRNTLVNFLRSRTKYLHISAFIRMEDNPLAVEAARIGKPFAGLKMIPCVQKPGVTYKKGETK